MKITEINIYKNCLLDIIKGNIISKKNLNKLKKLIFSNNFIDIFSKIIKIKENYNFKDEIIIKFIKQIENYELNKIKCYFFLNKNSLNKLINLINSSKKSIYVCLFIITNNILTNLLIEAKKRNVEIKIIIEFSNIKY